MLTFRLNAAAIDAEVAALKVGLVVAGAKGRVLSGCLYGGYFLNCLVVTTFPLAGPL